MSDELRERILDKCIYGWDVREINKIFQSDQLIASGLPLYLLLIEVIEVVVKAVEVVLARVVQVLHPSALFLCIFNFLNVSR